MNIPKEQRFKPENVVVVGIIPGSKLHMSSFLQPLVNDLMDLWDGVLLDSRYGTYDLEPHFLHYLVTSLSLEKVVA